MKPIALLAVAVLSLAACAAKPVDLKPQPAKQPVKLKAVGSLTVEPAAAAASSALQVRP